MSSRAATFTKFGKRLHRFRFKTRNFQVDFFIMQIGKKSIFSCLNFFLIKTQKNVPGATFKIVWWSVVIELSSSNWKVIATCADLFMPMSPLSLSTIILIAVDNLSNTAKSRKLNKQYFSLGNAINKP